MLCLDIVVFGAWNIVVCGAWMYHSVPYPSPFFGLKGLPDMVSDQVEKAL
jgi:hypothetical protein